MKYDKIIIGAGIYGLYAALKCGKQGQHIVVLECDNEAFARATYINQARVHMGYHYPRSFSTAIKSANYFERFHEDYGFCVNSTFDQIYATSSKFSWTNAGQFEKFCKAAAIRCEEVAVSRYFKHDLCDGAFLTKEYTYDAHILRDFFLKELSHLKNVEIWYNVRISRIQKEDDSFVFILKNQRNPIASNFVLNATYASVNQILSLAGYELFKIKYELCEIILCDVSDNMKKIGLTVMDGPFFSIMPFGKTGLHSLTAVTFTPHVTSHESLPQFNCQKESKGYCSSMHLGNCNICISKPRTAWNYMSALARKYMKSQYEFNYKNSLFSMKPILKASEIDDSRPTVIKKFSDSPTFISVLSGKINTVYDLDEVLN